jgi:mono/diheme cytochrome c family protein
MSAETEQCKPIAAEDAEPVVGRAAAPIWLITVLIVLGYGGMLYLNENAGGFSAQVYEPYVSIDELAAAQPKSAEGELADKGRKIFTTDCQVCHQPNGMGMPGQFPPLAGSDWVNAAAANRIIRIVLNGAQGPITINGAPFTSSSAMVPWRDILKDDDIAAVLTFVRGNKEWGNHGGPVTPDQVKTIRAKIKDNTQPFSPDQDLKNLADGE